MLRLLHLIGVPALVATIALAPGVSRSASAGDAVLLASTVPGYMPGMVVSASDRLSLPEGATATLLFQSGEMLHLRGPFEGTLAQQQATGGSGSVAMLADMFRTHGVDATVIGGTRSVGPANPDADIDDVLVDPQRSGTYCVAPSTSVWIAQPAAADAAYALRRNGSTRMIAWPSGATRIEWPGDVPIEDGSQFEITADGSAHATVTFHAMPSAAPSISAEVAAGVMLGCRDQFDNELRRIGRAIVGPELWMTTNHGQQPRYHQGDPVDLSVVANVDGYLYCVAMRDGRDASPIFPAGAVDGAQVRSSVPVSIPGRRQPAALSAEPGITQIRCWLTDRNVTAELPHALLGLPSTRLPDQLASELDTVFSRVAGPAVTTDVLTLKTSE